MTNEELIRQLRNSKGWPTLGNAAANKIEELRKERDKWSDYAHLYSAWANEVGMLLEERRDTLDPEDWEDQKLLALMGQAEAGIVTDYRATEEQG